MILYKFRKWFGQTLDCLSTQKLGSAKAVPPMHEPGLQEEDGLGCLYDCM